MKDAVEYNIVNGGPKTKDMGGNAGSDEAARAIITAMDKIKV